MANNLKDHLKEVADAIRAKKGTSDLINPQDFAAEIEGISGGGNNSNWRYFATTDLDIFYATCPFVSLVKCTRDGEVIILTAGAEDIVNNSDSLMAIAFGMNQVVYFNLGEKLITTVGEGVEFALEMEGKDMSHLGVEITKEEFYHIDKSGAYIQHIDGTLYTADQWTAGGFSNDEANGIARISESTNDYLVVAKDSLGELPWSSMPNTLIEEVVTTTDLSSANNDTKGVENTALIAAADPNSAAAACANYTFPNGQKGYLGAVGESWSIDGIDTLLELIGGTPLGDVFIWTSTQNNAEKAWYYRVNGLYDQCGVPKSDNLEVRPVCTLENYKFPQNA